MFDSDEQNDEQKRNATMFLSLLSCPKEKWQDTDAFLMAKDALSNGRPGYWFDKVFDVPEDTIKALITLHFGSQLSQEKIRWLNFSLCKKDAISHAICEWFLVFEGLVLCNEDVESFWLSLNLWIMDQEEYVWPCSGHVSRRWTLQTPADFLQWLDAFYPATYGRVKPYAEFCEKYIKQPS